MRHAMYMAVLLLLGSGAAFAFTVTPITQDFTVPEGKEGFFDIGDVKIPGSP